MGAMEKYTIKRKKPRKVAHPAVSAPSSGAERLGAVHVRVDHAGRLVVPAKFRKALGIEGGAELTASLKDGGIRLQTVDAAVARAQALAKSRHRGRAGDVVDRFIAERRAEAAKE